MSIANKYYRNNWCFYVIGQKQLVFVLMEVKKKIKRIYKNSDSIDWFLTEFLKVFCRSRCHIM